VFDLKLLRGDPDAVRRSQLSRGEDPALVDALLTADADRRSAISTADNLRAEQKSASKSVGAASPEDRPALLQRAKELAEQVKAAEAGQAEAESAITAAHKATSNVIVDGVPARLAIRYRDASGKPQIAATLNGTLATTRWLVAILENHQQPDGSVRVPDALVGSVGTEVLEPVG
jgi:seryl-tRNA synthetase